MGKRRRKNSVKRPTEVFIAHGRDQTLRNELEAFLMGIGVKPITLDKQPDEGLTIIEKLEKSIGPDIGYSIVLVTPDDVGYPVTEIQKEEKDRNVELRPRQNVILEYGYLLQKLGRDKVCVICKKGVTLPSDMRGIVYKEVNDSIGGIRYPLMRELRKAGYKIKI